MAFFHQLKLLLWKNGLGIIRRPFWSVTLILWPIIIFIVIAVTRHQFPPRLRQTCYVGPRNLPSTGFFPFLETLMCNVDSDCHNMSRLTQNYKQPSRPKRSTHASGDSPLSTLLKAKKLMQYADPDNKTTTLLKKLHSIIDSSSRESMVIFNQSRAGDQMPTNLTESGAAFKSVICSIALPMIKASPPNHAAAALKTFCRSKNTAFEVALNTLDQVLIELMTSQPEQLAKLAGEAMTFFDQLQSESSLWESLLSLPNIFNPNSPDQVLPDLEKLLSNLQKIIYFLEDNFPGVKNITSSIHRFLVAGIKSTEYLQNWPGKNVSILFGDIVTGNESLLHKLVNIEIPLHKAIALAVNREMVREFICKNSSGPIWALCSTSSLDMVLDWISPNKLAQQILLSWSKSVAQQDLAFIEGILHSLGGIFEGSGATRTASYTETQAQNIEEKLFLQVGRVVLGVIQFFPELDAIVQYILPVGFQSMKTATQAIVTVESMVENVLTDVRTVHAVIQTLMTNESQTIVLMQRALDSVYEIIAKILAYDNITCDTILDQFEWVLSTKTIKREVVQSVFCGNTTIIEHALLMDWIPLISDAQKLYSVFANQTKINATLPMILSEWHKLNNTGLGFGGFLLKLEKDWSEGYLMNWISENSSTNHLVSSLQQSVWLFMIKLGQKFEESTFWPAAKSYFHMALWILNSTDTSEPNCTMNMNTSALECEIDFDWTRLSYAITTLLSQSEEVFISCIQRSVHVLRLVYSDLYKQLAASKIKDAIPGGDKLSAFLIKMLNEVDNFALNLTSLPDLSLSNPQAMLPLFAHLLKSVGFEPLLPLLMHDGPVNISQVLEVASKLGRTNQGIFTFNESDPTMAQLENYIMQFLSMEGNFSLSLSLGMSQTLLTYHSYFNPDNVAELKQAIQPFTHQTSSGIVEAILSSLELLKKIMDAPSGDPSHVILDYIHQLQHFLVSLFPIQRIEQIVLPDGQVSPALVTNLHLLSDMFSLLTPEAIVNLTNGPVAAQHMIIQKFVKTLPAQVREESTDFLHKVVSLQSELVHCEADQDCLGEISELLYFLDQILNMTLGAKGNVTINIRATNMGSEQFIDFADAFFALTLNQNDAAIVKTVQETLQFISILLTRPNITLSSVQEALKQSNLTIDELNNLVMWLGTKDVNDLLEKVTKLQNAQKCFEQASLVSVAHCAVGMVSTISDLLRRLPALQNHTSILSMIPHIVNQTVTNMIRTNFTSMPQNALAESLKATLASVKMTLELNNVSSPVIQNEMEVLAGLIELIGNPEPLKFLNMPVTEFNTSVPVLKIVHWYLERLENVTDSSTISDLLYPLFRITQMQVALQLAQMELFQLIDEQVWHLINNLQYPIDGEGVVQIANRTAAILDHVLKFVVVNLQTQNAPSSVFGYDPPINMTFVNATVMQIHNYIRLLQQWMIQANLGKWANLNYTSEVEKHIYHLVQSSLHFFNVDQQGYLHVIANITQALNQALMLATQPNGLQSEQFSEALLKAVQILINGSLPSGIQPSIVSAIKNAVWLAVHTEASYSMAVNATVHMLHNLQFLIEQIFPQNLVPYPIGALKMITIYFEFDTSAYGMDGLNQLILNEMYAVESLIPANSTAHFYISTVINITKAILQPVQGNHSLLSLSPSEENLPNIFAQAVKLLNMLCPIFVGESCKPLHNSSLEGFADLPHVLERLMTGQASEETWRKLQELIDILLTVIEPHTPDKNRTCFVEMFEKTIGNEVKNRKAETDLISRFQTPVLTLITNLTHSLNSSYFNVSEVSERLGVTIKETVNMFEKANGTSSCQEVLKLWEPLREAMGISPSFMTMWCSISLQPVIDRYVKEMSRYTQDNWTECTEMGPMSAKAAAARMVKTLRSLYNTAKNQSHVTDQFIQALYTRFLGLIQQPLSLNAQLNLNKQLQQSWPQSSFQSIKQLSKELEDEFPFLKPYLNAVEKMVTHILMNYQQMDEPDDIFSEAVMILLSSMDVPSHEIKQILSRSLSSDSWVDLVMKSIKTMIGMKIFGDRPELYSALDQLLFSNDTRMVLHKVAEMISWFTSTPAKGLDLVVETLTKLQELLSSVLTLLSNMDDDPPPYLQLLHDLVRNAMNFIQQLLTSGSIPLRDHYDMRQHTWSGHNTSTVRHRRDIASMSTRGLVDDFVYLLHIDYGAIWKSLEVESTPSEILETVHVVSDNKNLSIVLKGATKDMDWGLEFSKDDTIDSILVVTSLLTRPEMDYSSLNLWQNVINFLPDGLPYVSLLKNVTQALAKESKENLWLMQKMLKTVGMLLQTKLTDPRLLNHLKKLKTQVCDLEKTDSIQILLLGFSLEPGILCNGAVPLLEILAEGLLFNMSTLLEDVFEVFVGDPRLYDIHANWAAAFSQAIGVNLTSLSVFNFTSTVAVVTIGEMVRNKTAFMLDMESLGFDPAVVFLLTEAALPDNNLEILSWLVDLRKCGSAGLNQMGEGEKALYERFCTMDTKVWYSFSLLMTQHLNTEKAFYRMFLPKKVQNVVQEMLHLAMKMMNMMQVMLPAIHQLEEYLISIESLGLDTNNEFREMSRSQRATISSGATFVTISRALCSKGILALFGVAQNPHVQMAPPTFDNHPKREEMIEQFKIPRNATPFCTNMYLDMVNTTGGAIAWAFLKPMLMGKILYTPDTPETQAIMNKANSTLQQLGDLRLYSQDWIKSSNDIVKSSEMLTQTLPLLQNSLGNSFVKNFIEMQTGINVDSMQETLNNFSNMTLLLEKNKDLLHQISTLSTLMVDLSSCITFDRYQGYDSEDELNRVAQELAKNRNLYASVIFKLPKDTSSSRKRRSASSRVTLPPEVRYTIRMHMDNVMRTDRVRDPFFIKDSHISARQTLRYNRGFIYLQETIDRAIIDIQANKTVTDTAVQIQPFPYPCHHRDEYLEAISFVFPLLLMIAWVLFVADFVKKLVYEREIKLHEYMKMMGVSPLSHFFAWFLESAFYLVVTIFFLTLVLKYGNILPQSNGFLLFLYMCDYGLSVLAFSFLISTFFNKTYIAALSGSLLYILSFFPFIVVMALETHFSFSVKNLLSLFSPTAFSYASQYISRYESQGEGIQWSNSYSSPIVGDEASFGWLCWLMLIDTFLYFIIGAYIRCVFPGKSGIPSPWYFPFTASFWKDLCCCRKSKNTGRGLFLTNILQTQPPVFPDNGKRKGKGDLSSKTGENFSDLPVGVSLYGLSKMYGQQTAIENLNVAFYEGHVTSLLGQNGAGKTTTMSILTGLFPPSSGTVEVYGRDMQANLSDIRKELGVCMQYDVLFDHMTAKEHLLLYGQIKAPHWSKRELQEQVRTILEETGMYAHRHKRVGTLSGGMKRKLSISIAFIGGSRLVVLDEPTTGVDPCSRRSIWDIVIQHKKGRTIIMSTHHLDEAEVLSDRIAFLERGGLKCCGSPYYLKEQLGQGYKLTLTKKMHNGESKQIDNAELKAFVQAHVPEAQLKEAQGSDLVYLLPPFSSNNASSYRSLLTALDSNLDALQLGCYGISDTTLEEVFLHLTHGSTDAAREELPTISDTVSDTVSINSYPESEGSNNGDTVCFAGTPTVSGVKLAWQQITAIIIKRFHHNRRDWKGLISQILLPVMFVVFAMGLGSIKSDLQHYPELELSPALYSIGPSYSFFRNPNSNKLADTMLSFPGLDNSCLQNSNDQVCTRSTGAWTTVNGTKKFGACKCVTGNEVCGARGYVPPHKQIPSSQIVYNVTDLNVENYLVATADDYIRNRYGGFDFGFPLPRNLKMDVKTVPENRTLSKVWFNPEGHHTMPAYLSGMNNLILRSSLPANKDPSQYAISVSSHPYFGRPDDEDSVVQGMLQIMITLCVMAGFSITTASFAIYEVNEYQSGSKRLQHIAGVSEPLYWIVNFSYDMVIYMIPVALTVGVIALFQVPAFTDRQNLGAVAVLLILFGFASFPWMYLLSTVFKGAEMAFISYVCINLFLTINTIIPTSVLYFMRQLRKQEAESLTVIFNRLSHAFLIFPQFNFGNGLLELTRMNIEVQILSGYGVDAYKNPFSTECLGWMMISSIIQGVVLFGLRLLWNKYIVRKVSRHILRRKSVHLVPSVDEDEDVAAEHLRVSSGAASSDVLQVNQLTKVYQHLNKKVPAVKKLSLGVPAGECFGLLGVNGAGKTTTFKMLTGDVSPTDGTAQIRDGNGRLVNIMECRNQGINIGYCPQVDALDDLLTGEEHLYFYARLHGISKREIPGVVNYLLRKLELNNYRDSVADSYSCGTRRKLSTALALVGHPQILLLDEPSSGMDPRTKRQLWKIISEEVKGKCAVVLTSHSMEECEALCGRLAIMVKGQFRCLGSLQHIKNRFGSGFTVKMYLVKASSDADTITRFMQSRFPSTYLKEQHSAMVEYHVPVAPGGVADIFGQLESSKEYLEIQHFSVSQTTLDEVFINFAMGKTGMETVPIDDEFDDDCSMKDVEA